MNILQKKELWNQYKNPFYHWWKVRKRFKRPKCHFIYGKDLWWFGLYINKQYYNKFIHFRTSAVGWKWKYDEPRYEWDPFIQIVFFRKYHLIWVFNWIVKGEKKSYIKNIATWESILTYLYCNKTLNESISLNEWDDDNAIITPKDNVK